MKKYGSNKIITLLLIISLMFNIGLSNAIFVYSKALKGQRKVLSPLKPNSDNKNLSFEKYYSEKLSKLFSQEELIILSQRQWGLKLTANGCEINNETIYLKDRNLKIVLAEYLKDKEKLLPDEILKTGTITGGDKNDSLSSHLEVISPIPCNIYTEKKDLDSRLCIEVKDIPRGTLITLRLSEILKYRLGLKDKLKEDIIKIVVN
ncbi:hypothetical protein SAMN05443428_11511 [Caloramator quimbayensis]|uniref:Uncharacterized protein n=1 Tax=Caloramator quimbayensis TaxID=1147123 RepID=A0A1T4XWK8_9CLOT|nr:hypothetical protein [Caloramator quimbayensis]SKA93900.1 hypothetical protein SAMN05443428_11511 [Caloramator quimbayensis]